MKTSLSSGTYKDQPAVLLESDQLQALIIPRCGANIASLIYKPTGTELLFQRSGAAYRGQPYDGTYTTGENAGFHDMFPTIDACYCNDAPWLGVPLPDHGEVWSLPWQEEPFEGGLHLSVHGVRLPYTLEKWITFPSPDVLRMDYRLTNHSPFPIHYLWAAHCMFNIGPGTQLVLPPGPERMTVTFSNNGKMGKYGDQFQWPLATLPDGSQRDLRQMRSADEEEVYKYYLRGALTQGWCAARIHPGGLAVGLSWPVDQAPYLAILPNEGGWDHTTSLHFEPSTCTFDRPDFGQYHGEAAVLGGMAVQAWHLNISAATQATFTHITPEGIFA